MKILIVTGGDLGDPHYIDKHSLEWDYIICVDSGARHLETLGLKADILIGDFDSISPSLLKKHEDIGTSILSYPMEKDWTDTQLAVDNAIDKGAHLVYIVGALGSRWDHSYANVMLLYRLEKRGIKAKILNSNNTISMSNNILDITGEIGQTISLLPFAGDVIIESTLGLIYSVKDLTVTMDYPIGVSNVLGANNAMVEIKSGWLIGILAND
ncbi:MAG TPA: thiamine diphosphokinase [Clostridia bacterium]|nr:thiamine diphosphokinase [Clostridia bacterium]